MKLITDMAAANFDKPLDENNWQDEFLDHETQYEFSPTIEIDERGKDEVDRKVKNWQTVKIASVLMLGFASAMMVNVLFSGQPTTALAIVAAAAGVYLFDAKEPDRD